jgi:hypothetical protein
VAELRRSAKMKLPNQQLSRFVIWPYIGTGTVAIIGNFLPEEPGSSIIMLLGVLLVCPFIPVQYAILNNKIDRTAGTIWGFIGPVSFFLLSGLIIGSAAALMKSK